MCVALTARHVSGVSVLATDCGVFGRQERRISPDQLSGAWTARAARWLAFDEPPRVRFRRLETGWVAAVGDEMYALLALGMLESHRIDLTNAAHVSATLAAVAEQLPSIARRYFAGWQPDFRRGQLFTATAFGIASYERDGTIEEPQIERVGAVTEWAGAVPGGLGDDGACDYEPRQFRAAVRTATSVFDVVRAIAGECSAVSRRTMCVTDRIQLAIGLDGYLVGSAGEIAGASDDALAARITAPGSNAPLDASLVARKPILVALQTHDLTAGVREIPLHDPVVRFLERDRRSWLAGGVAAGGCQVPSHSDA